MPTEKAGKTIGRDDPPPPQPVDRDLPGRGHPHAPAATPQQVQKALQEAQGVTATQHGGQVELQLGHFCNNRCVFCGSGQLTERGLADPIPEAAVLAALQAVAVTGIRRVTFLGGEPTIQDSFLPGLRAAVALGFSEIVVFTNGARLWDARFVAAVEAAARGGAAPVDLQWRVSLQGGDAASHDLAVGRKGAFAKILLGLQLLRGYQREVTVNMCLTSGSVATLPDLAGVLLGNGVRQVCIDMVRPISAGERTEAWMRRILPRLSDLAAPMRQLVQRLQKADPEFDVNLTHVPYCVAPDLARHIHHGGEATVTFTADLAERQGVMDKYAFQATDRRLMEGCKTCVFAWRCTGVTHQYLEWHGQGEFAPQTAQSLEAAGLVPLAIVDVVRTALGDLAAGVRVGAWRLLSASFDPRLPRAELRWRGPDKAEFAMGIGAGRGSPLPDRLPWWRFASGCVDVAVGAGLPSPDQLQAFAEWLSQRLGPGQLLVDHAALRHWGQHHSWLARALLRLVARQPGVSVQQKDGVFELAWSGEAGPQWLRLAAGASSPVAHRQLGPALSSPAPGDAAQLQLAELSSPLGQCLKETRPGRRGPRPG